MPNLRALAVTVLVLACRQPSAIAPRPGAISTGRDASLRTFVDSMVARGSRHVTGRVVAAGDRFPGSELGYGWSYEDFEDSYSAPIDELLFNEGFTELHVRAGERAGDPVAVVARPVRSYPRVR